MTEPKVAFIPLMPIGIALGASYTFADYFMEYAYLAYGLILIGVLLNVVALNLYFFNFRNRFILYTIASIGFFLFGTGYFYELYADRNSKDLGAISVNADLEIKKHSSYIIAQIKDIDVQDKCFIGEEVSLSIKKENPILKELRKGQLLRVEGTLMSVELAEDPFRSFLKSQKVDFILRAKNIKIKNKENSYYEFLANAKAYIAKKLSLSVLEYKSDLYAGMILGDKSYMSKEQKNLFARTGTMHIFAISGLHIGIAAFFMYYILRFCRVWQRAIPVIVLVILFLYVSLTGLQASALRAFYMLAFAWLAMCVNRNLSPLGALVLTWVVSLLYKPIYIFEAGFNLSYIVVGSLIMYGVPLYKYLYEKYSIISLIPEEARSNYVKFKDYLLKTSTSAFAISIASSIGASLPTSYYFGYVVLGGILFVVPCSICAFLAVCGAILSIILPNFLASYSNLLGMSALFVIDYLVKLVGNLFDISSDLKINSGLYIGIGTLLFFLMSVRIKKPYNFVISAVFVMLYLKIGNFLQI